VAWKVNKPFGVTVAGRGPATPALLGQAMLVAQMALDDVQYMGGKGFRKRRKQLDDGSWVEAVVIQNGPVPFIKVKIYSEGIIEVYYSVTIVDYDCGAVIGPTIDQEADPYVIAAHVQTEQGQIRIPEQISKERHAVELRQEFATMADMQAIANGTLFSQHRRIRPGNYTGYMRQLVQLLLGVGIAQEETYEKRIVEEGFISPITLFESDKDKLVDTWGIYKKPPDPLEPKTASINYDYRFNRTHGLTWNAAGTCFVIQISNKGIHAWPLPLDQDCLLPAVKAQYEVVYPELFELDESGLGLFDLFGGFPSWEPAPMAPELEDRVKAGDVLCLLDADGMADFYSKQPHYSNCGWAFAPLDTLAVNTCFSYYGGVKKGHLYTARWFIGEWIEPEWTAETRQLAQDLQLRETWQVNKARRLKEEQLQQIAEEDPEARMDLFLELTATCPCTDFDVQLVEQQNGWLYHPGKYTATGDHCLQPNGHPQFKVPEEAMGYLITIDLTVDLKNEAIVPPKECDAPVWACFVNDQLMVVNYYWSAGEPQTQEPINTREECQYVGSWETMTASTAAVQGNFYSHCFDLRREVKTSGGTYAKTIGSFVGTKSFWQFYALLGNCCYIGKEVYFITDTDSVSLGGAKWWSGAAVPFGDRSIVYTATMMEERGRAVSRTVSKPYSPGTTGYTKYGYVYEWIWHWVGSCPSGKSVPNPETCVLSPMIPDDFVENCLSEYGPPEFPDYRVCDDDPFCTGDPTEESCPPYTIKYSAIYNDEVPDLPGYTNNEPVVNKYTWEVKIWGDTHLHGRVVLKGTDSGVDMERFETPMTDWWWLTSPTCDPPQYCSFDVAVNCWGRGLISYDDQVDPFKTFHDGAPESMFLGSKAVFFGYVSDQVITHG